MYLQPSLSASKKTETISGNDFLLKRKEASWDRSPGFKAMVKRQGFPVVPYYAATAHSVTGATLSKAIIDLLDANTTPRTTMIPTSYVAISRTKRATDQIITQPFSPKLFRQGHQIGPWLLHCLTADTKTVSYNQSRRPLCCSLQKHNCATSPGKV